jgi:hypothetical protein
MDPELMELIKKVGEHGGPYVLLVVFGLFTSFFGAWFKTRVDANMVERNENRKDFVTINTERKSMLDAQSAEIKELKSQILTMQSRISALEGRVAQRPFGEWSLSFNGLYTWANLEMVNRFLRGRTPDWIIGKTHRDIWPPSVMHIFERLDDEVRASTIHMAVATNVRLLDGDYPYIVIKYGQADPNTGAVINYYGMAIPMLPLSFKGEDLTQLIAGKP